MAGRNSLSPSSRTVSQRGSLDTSTTGSLAENEQFMQWLAKLPDELIRLLAENRKLKKAIASASSVDSSSKRHEEWLETRWQAREKQLISKQESRIVQLRTQFRIHYEQQLQNNLEVLQKNNSELQRDLFERKEEITNLKKKLLEYEQQLQLDQVSSASNHQTMYKQQMLKAKQALAEKRRELDSFKERYAAFSERRVRSDQRRTENTLSRNRQSQLESEYVTDFKDGARVDAIDVMAASVRRRQRRTSISQEDYLRCSRFACFIFETAYEIVANIKESFSIFTSTVLETLAGAAPAIRGDYRSLERELYKRQCDQPKETVSAAQDALSEVLILVKEEANIHDLTSLIQDVKQAITEKWRRFHYSSSDRFLPEYDSYVLHELNEYISYCTRFSWCALTQVPPMKIDYSTGVYNSRSHVVCQAFSSPSRRTVHLDGLKIRCYLWPVLQDFDGKAIRKGEVVLSSYC